MDIQTLFIALPVFVVIYQGVGMFLESRKSANQTTWHEPNPPSRKPLQDLLNLGAGLGLNKRLLKFQGMREKQDILLLRSGNPFGWNTEIFLLYKELAAILTMILLWRLQYNSPVVLVAGGYLGFKALDIYMSMKVSYRQTEIQHQLPGYVDLLALGLESGLDLLVATERIIAKMKPTPLRSELQTLVQENRLGTPRKDALQHLAFRANLPDIHSMTSMIIQSEELGTSLSAVLRAYAEDMRSKRVSRAEEMAGKAPVKLLFPMMVFFFPIVFIVIFGPLALNLITSYK